jgi:serine/threonine protein kinase
MAKNDNIDDPNEWIEKAISKKQIKYYKYKYFNNIKEIGTGSFGKVYRASWKDSEKYLAIKSFYKATTKEIVETVNANKKDFFFFFPSRSLIVFAFFIS